MNWCFYRAVIDVGDSSSAVGLTMSDPVPRNTPTPLLETIGVNPVDPSPKSNADWDVVGASWPEIGKEFGRSTCGGDDKRAE